MSMDVVIRVGDRAVHKPGGVLCPHLEFQEGTTNASCKVHHKPWFKDTPCHVYGNPDIDYDFENKRGKPCPVGKMIQERGGLLQLYPKVERAESAALADLGPWLASDAEPQESDIEG